MSGVLRPVGPEPMQTYWVRRGLVFAAAAVLLVTLTLIITSTSSGSAAAPGPASASPTSQAAPSSSAMETAIPTQSFVSASATREPAAKKSPKLKASPRKSQSAAQSCAPKELRTTLTGKQRIVAKRRTTFQLSLINGSAQTCASRVTAKNFQLKINYGDDRIWSTDDCPAMIKTISRNLRSEHVMAWSVTWDGKRSKSPCKSVSQALRPGSYVATAQLEGAAPVKLRMIVKAGN